MSTQVTIISLHDRNIVSNTDVVVITLIHIYCSLIKYSSNNMNHTTLGIVAVLVAAALVVGTFAATTPAFAKSKVKVGDTKNKCVSAADNGQHAANGPGSIADAFVNLPLNVQIQLCNAGSTGAG